MKKLIFLIKFVVFLFVSQSVDLNAQIAIEEEDGVSNLISRYETLNQQNSAVKAWRIQIIATNDRRKMETAVSKFKRLYPELEYDWKHAAPYYQVYIGAYEKKEDFEAFILQLKKDFPSSIPVIDQIEKSKLL